MAPERYSQGLLDHREVAAVAGIVEVDHGQAGKALDGSGHRDVRDDQKPMIRTHGHRRDGRGCWIGYERADSLVGRGGDDFDPSGAEIGRIEEPTGLINDDLVNVPGQGNDVAEHARAATLGAGRLRQQVRRQPHQAQSAQRRQGTFSYNR